MSLDILNLIALPLDLLACLTLTLAVVHVSRTGETEKLKALVPILVGVVFFSLRSMIKPEVARLLLGLAASLVMIYGAVTLLKTYKRQKVQKQAEEEGEQEQPRLPTVPPT